MMPSFLICHDGNEAGFMSWIKALQEASTTAVNEEDLWIFFAAQLSCFFPRKYSADDSPLVLSCSAFQLPCLAARHVG